MSTGITPIDLPVRRMPLPGGPLAVVDVGDGTPAVFVPGYTGGKEDFALLAAPVTGAGYRYVAVDQRGQHESPGPEDPAAYSIAALATHLLELLSDVGRAHVVGHSFGGLVARAATIVRPDAVASLVLLDSGPAALVGPRVDAYRALEPVLDIGGRAAVFEAILAAAVADPARRPATDEVVAFLRRRFLASSEAGLRAMGDALLTEPDRTEALRATGVPVLVAWGEHDDAWPPAVQQDMAERLGARYAEIPGAVHSPAAERPAETAALLLSFWA